MQLTRALKVGVHGADVLELEHQLQKRGYLTFAVPDMVFGDQTEADVIRFQQTHLGPKGRPLTVDGWVGPETWWALQSRDIDQRSGLGYRYAIPVGIGEQRTQILEVALTEHRDGVREEPMGSNRGDRIDEYTGWKGVPKGDPGPKWCCYFATWCLHESIGLYPLGGRIGSCLKSAQLAKALPGRWVDAADPAGVMVPGDVFVMLYRDANGNLKGTGHTGLIATVAPDQARFNTLEGNCGNRVKLGLRKRSELAGWWHPCDVGSLPSDFERRIFEAPGVAREATT